MRAAATMLPPFLIVTLCLSVWALAHPEDETSAGARSAQSATRPPDTLALSQRVRAGSGEFAYESVPNWCQVPADRKGVLGPTHGGVVVDKAGNVYFSMDSGPAALMVYSPDGKFLRSLGGKDMTGIHGMVIRDEGGEQFIYAAHLAGKRALKLKLDGSIVWQIPADEVLKASGKYQNAGQYSPTAIAVAPNGAVYIADGYGQNWIHQFDKDRKYVRSFGGGGTEPGKFKTCPASAPKASLASSF